MLVICSFKSFAQAASAYSIELCNLKLANFKIILNGHYLATALENSLNYIKKNEQLFSQVY